MNYLLSGYGIPIEYMPCTDTGKIKLKHWNDWLKSRLVIESEHIEDKNVGIVECPCTNDVVFRHGQAYKKFNGNDTLRDWIESEIACRKMSASSLQSQSQSQSQRQSESSYNNRDDAATKTSIDQFCNRLIGKVEKNQKGRFLKWDNTLRAWVQMLDEIEIKKKISASYYNYSKRNYVKLVQRQNNEDGLSYKFIEGGEFTTDFCSTARITDNTKRKKPRSELFTKI